jgi:acetyltransferase
MTSLNDRYPTHMIDVVQWDDGTRVVVRPPLPQDAELQRAFFGQMSKEDRYSRFMTPLRELPETLAHRFSSIDYRSHVALLAAVFQDQTETMVGEARYVVDDSDPTSCEFAVAVADAWQMRGMAHLLLERLEAHASASGLSRMTASTLVTNTAMIALAVSKGYSITPCPGDRSVAYLEKVLVRAVPALCLDHSATRAVA